MITPLVVLTLACAHHPRRADVALVGEWTPSMHDGERTTIVTRRGRARVVSIIDHDGEVFDVKLSGWQDDRFTWVYRVPSTGYIVVVEVDAVTADRMQTTWTNHERTGHEELIRIR
ncbi:MAG: hypothetical protein D6798_02645 [Deltaproteobacteria bacterium]|nr:MAG: hypothetical protein D6798_02645 [Deltaproteobacteria bacterium]